MTRFQGGRRKRRVQRTRPFPNVEVVLCSLALTFSLLSLAPLANASGDQSSSWAVESNEDPSKTEYLINMRALEGQEREHYVQVSAKIEKKLQSPDPVVVVRAVEDLASEISALPECVQDDTRDALYTTISQTLAEAELDPTLKPVVTALLDSGQPRSQLIALEALGLSPEVWWVTDVPTSRRLTILLTTTDTAACVRESILGKFFVADEFDSVRAFAWTLARDESDADLAREAAACACAAMADDKFRPREVYGAFVTSTGVLKQEAALALSRFQGTKMSASVKDEVVAELVAMATDKNLSALVRGEAIEQLGRYAGDPLVLDSLSTLLRPELWFFGVRGHHHLEHSLSVVVPAIANADIAVVRPRLLELQKHIGSIEPEARWQVEYELNSALEVDSPRPRKTS